MIFEDDEDEDKKQKKIDFLVENKDIVIKKMDMVREFMAQTGATLAEIVLSLLSDDVPEYQKFLQSLTEQLHNKNYYDFIIEKCVDVLFEAD